MAGGSDTASNSQLSSEISDHQEHLLFELETSEAGSIGLVLRAIYDGGDVRKFMDTLERKIKQCDRDIERMCSVHYEGFIEAIRQLLLLKAQCQTLKDDICETDDHLQESTRTLVKHAEEIVKQRRMQTNASSAIHSITLCLPMLDKFAKLQEQMSTKRYYPALKTLEQLEHTYFPELKRYSFVDKLIQKVTTIREEIENSSFNEFKDFLEGIRMVSARATEQQNSMDSSIQRYQRKKMFPASTSAALAKSGSSNSRDSSPDKHSTDDEEFSAQDIVDFSPVYRCCHIFSVLGRREYFENYYRNQRTEQANATLREHEKLRLQQEYVQYFHNIIGFFVVEDHVMHTAPGLVTRSYRDELWDSAFQTIKKSLDSRFGKCTDANMMLSIKRLILRFVLTLKAYGFPVQEFLKLLRTFGDQYNEILMAECCARFEAILGSDNYTPITVENIDQFNQIVDRFPYRNVDLESQSFPKRFPFSSFVPKIYEQIKLFINGCYKFTDELGYSQNEIDDNLRRNTNLLLDRLNGNLKAYLSNQGDGLTLTQLIQVPINMNFLEKGCDESLELYISNLVKLNQDKNTNTVKLRQGSDMFLAARDELKEQIARAIREKLDELLAEANYNWELSESSGKASEYITTLVDFMNSTFLAFTNLTPSLARSACLSACQHVALALTGFILGSEDIRAISMGALDQLNLDLMQCEHFAASCPVPGFEDGTLLLTFAKLRQLFDLFTSQEWSAYISDYGHENSNYERLDPSTVIKLLEKVIEADRRKNNSGLFTRSKDKDKKKLLDTVLKQLRGLLVNSGAV